MDRGFDPAGTLCELPPKVVIIVTLRMDEEPCDASARAAWICQDGHERVLADLWDQLPRYQA